MPISIKELEKAAVFRAFYNRANPAFRISLEQARIVFAAFTRSGDFYFSKIDAVTYLEDDSADNITQYLTGASINIDFSGDEIDTSQFDKLYDDEGLGKRLVDDVRTLTVSEQSLQAFFTRQKLHSAKQLVAPSPITREAPAECSCAIL